MGKEHLDAGLSKRPAKTFDLNKMQVGKKSVLVHPQKYKDVQQQLILWTFKSNLIEHIIGIRINHGACGLAMEGHQGETSTSKSVHSLKLT